MVGQVPLARRAGAVVGPHPPTNYAGGGAGTGAGAVSEDNNFLLYVLEVELVLQHCQLLPKLELQLRYVPLEDRSCLLHVLACKRHRS